MKYTFRKKTEEEIDGSQDLEYAFQYGNNTWYVPDTTKGIPNRKMGDKLVCLVRRMVEANDEIFNKLSPQVSVNIDFNDIE